MDSENISQHRTWFGVVVPKKVFRIGLILLFIVIGLNIILLISSFSRGLLHQKFSGSHAGKILEINTEENKIIIEENKDRRTSVFISTSTTVRKGEKTDTTENLKVGDYIFVTGPDTEEKNIQGKMIRVFDKNKPIINEEQ